MGRSLFKFLLVIPLLLLATLFFNIRSDSATTNQHYIYKSGLGEEKEEFDTNTFLTLNVCMFRGRMPALFGGVTAPVAERSERLAHFLKKESPDIFVAQEVPLESGAILFEDLKKQYPHFWIGISPNSGQQESELFVASKYPILGDPIFIAYPEDMQRLYKLPVGLQRLYLKKMVKRGFFYLETEHFWMVTTHMEPEDQKICCSYRARQLRFLTEKMDQVSASSGKPYILAGDLNIKRTAEADDEYSTTSGIPELFYDFYTEKNPGFNDMTHTCTNLMTFWVNKEPVPTDPRAQNEIDDYVLIRKHHKELFKNLDVHLLTNTYDLSDPQEALSDHRAYKTSFSFD